MTPHAPTSPLRPRDPRHDMLVRATLAPDPESRAAYERWRRDVDLNTLDGPSVRMLPLLARRLEGADADALAEQVQRVVRFTWLRTQMMMSSTLPALRALAERHLPVMLVKGAAVIHHTGMNLAVRPMHDLDVCVPVDMLAPATHALVAAGFSSELESLLASRPQAIAGTVTGIPFTDARGVTIDLHWHLLHQRRHPGSDRDFWAGAAASSLREVPCLVTSREDTLLHVIEHGAIWHVDPVLQWTTDAALLVGGAPLDWDRVVWQAARQRLAPALADGLGYLADVGVAGIPEAQLSRLSSMPPGRVEAALGWAARRRGVAGVVASELRRDLEQDLPPGARVTPRGLIGAAWRAGAPLRGPAPSGLPPLALGETALATLRPDGGGCPYLIAGWHYPEAHGTWSRDRRARIVLPLAAPTDGPLVLEADVSGFITPARPRLAVEVRLGGRLLVTWPFQGIEPAPERRTAWIPPQSGRRLLDLRLIIRHPRDGVTARHNGDPRPLGVAVRSLTLRAATAPGPVSPGSPSHA